METKKEQLNKNIFLLTNKITYNKKNYCQLKYGDQLTQITVTVNEINSNIKLASHVTESSNM